MRCGKLRDYLRQRIVGEPYQKKSVGLGAKARRLVRADMRGISNTRKDRDDQCFRPYSNSAQGEAGLFSRPIKHVHVIGKQFHKKNFTCSEYGQATMGLLDSAEEGVGLARTR